MPFLCVVAAVIMGAGAIGLLTPILFASLTIAAGSSVFAFAGPGTALGLFTDWGGRRRGSPPG